MRPVPIAPILMRLLGAFGPNTDAGTIVGNPATRMDEAPNPLPTAFKNSRRNNGHTVFTISSLPETLWAWAFSPDLWAESPDPHEDKIRPAVQAMKLPTA